MSAVLAVFLGGGLGSAARFLLSAVMSRALPGLFPYGTFAVNALGSLLLGVLTGLALRDMLPPGWRWFLGVGFCGGFTTFSTFSLELVLLVRDGSYSTACVYTVVSIAVALAAVAAGLWLTRP